MAVRRRLAVVLLLVVAQAARAAAEGAQFCAADGHGCGAGPAGDELARFRVTTAAPPRRAVHKAVSAAPGWEVVMNTR